jgi:hypothetical protein
MAAGDSGRAGTRALVDDLHELNLRGQTRSDHHTTELTEGKRSEKEKRKGKCHPEILAFGDREDSRPRK